MISRLSQEQFKNQEKDSRESFIKKIQDSRESFIKKIQDSRIIKIKIQDSKIQESGEDLIKISIKKYFKTLSSTRSFHKIITKEFYFQVIDYQIVVIDYQCFKTLRFSKFKMKSHIC